MTEKANFSIFCPNSIIFQKKFQKTSNFKSTHIRPNVWWKISFYKFWPKIGQIWSKFWSNLVNLKFSKSLSGFYMLGLPESQIWVKKINAGNNNPNNSVFFWEFLKLIYNNFELNPQVRGLSCESPGHVSHCKPSGKSVDWLVPFGNVRRTVYLWITRDDGL